MGDGPFRHRENAHLTYLGTQLAHHGIEPAANLVIRDRGDIKLFEAWKNPILSVLRVVWVPPDDLTRETIAEELNEKLIYDGDRTLD